MLIDPLILLQAYSIGVFPMSDDRDARDVYWVEPKYRAILPLEQFHLSHSLARVLRRDRFRVTANRAIDWQLDGLVETMPSPWRNPATSSKSSATGMPRAVRRKMICLFTSLISQPSFANSKLSISQVFVLP